MMKTMKKEIESKFIIKNKNHINAIKKFLNKGFLYYKKMDFINSYYDTNDLFFSKNKIVIRIRNINFSEFLQTIKFEEYKNEYFSIRNEYENKIKIEKIDFSFLPNNIEKIFSPYKKFIQKIYYSKFYREIWLYKKPKILIEISIDFGTIFYKEKKMMISELELELKTGSISDLLNLSNVLTRKLLLEPKKTSKSQDGVDLINS